jgi:trk system potassium uptake protein TrkH
MQELPALVILIGLGALSMLAPALHAAALEDWPTARAFLYSALLSSILFLLMGRAMAGHEVHKPARARLLTLVGALTLLPVQLAVPLYEAVPGITFFDAWFEMVASFTTTGATLLSAPGAAPMSVHLWRAEVGWLGGFFTWVTAIAVLAPMSLGGFEVDSPDPAGRDILGKSPITRVADMPERLRSFAIQFLPIYASLTLVLTIALIMAGDAPLIALCHAMSTLSTSGISPVGGMVGSDSGVLGEVLILLFLVFALSRQTFTFDDRSRRARALRKDPELQLGLLLVVSVPILLFLRHWIGAFESEAEGEAVNALRAFWGGIFTVMSFLTTTGFESASWTSARVWSALETPGLILMGLALVGGGVATTAGGVKLLRVYVLYKHGLREMERLVHPSSVGGAGVEARRIRRRGAFVAWIFFMLFALSVAVVLAALALTGIDFQQTIVLTIAALSTTGPLAWTAPEIPVSYAALSEPAKAILAAAMVLGRLETLALIALLNPDFWRG